MASNNSSRPLDRRRFLGGAALSAGALAFGGVLPGCSVSGKGTGPAGGRPNILFLLADDLGWGDVKAFNPASKIPTPNLDRLAREGMRFTDAHSGSAVCTPTRYGVVTGRYCWRSPLERGVLNGWSPHLIEPVRCTVARLLEERGYHTACVGKWHLVMDFPRKGKKGGKRGKVDYEGRIENGPNALGFDYFYGISASLDFPPYVYIENDRFTEVPDRIFPGSRFPAYLRRGPMGPSFKPMETLDHLAGKAEAYLEERAESRDGKPFFLYFALTSPHKPVIPTPEFKGKSGLGDYGDHVMHTDAAVGRILDTLARTGLEKNTLLIITSDNGSFMFLVDSPDCPRRLVRRDPKTGKLLDHLDVPGIQGYLSSRHRPNGPFRGTKADIWEGGHREPFIARWPGKIRPGSVCAETICLGDLTATCAEISGGPLPEGAGPDSFSFLPLLLGKEETWSRPPVIHHSGNGTFAIREGKWKLIAGSGSGGRGVPRSRPWSRPYQLYDLEADPGERENLIEKHPHIAARLTARLQEIIRAGRSV